MLALTVFVCVMMICTKPQKKVNSSPSRRMYQSFVKGIKISPTLIANSGNVLNDISHNCTKA